MVRRLATAPAESFPKLVGSDAELEGVMSKYPAEVILASG